MADSNYMTVLPTNLFGEVIGGPFKAGTPAPSSLGSIAWALPGVMVAAPYRKRRSDMSGGRDDWAIVDLDSALKMAEEPETTGFVGRCALYTEHTLLGEQLANTWVADLSVREDLATIDLRSINLSRALILPGQSDWPSLQRLLHFIGDSLLDEAEDVLGLLTSRLSASKASGMDEKSKSNNVWLEYTEARMMQLAVSLIEAGMAAGAAGTAPSRAAPWPSKLTPGYAPESWAASPLWGKAMAVAMAFRDAQSKGLTLMTRQSKR